MRALHFCIRAERDAIQSHDKFHDRSHQGYANDQLLIYKENRLTKFQQIAKCNLTSRAREANVKCLEDFSEAVYKGDGKHACDEAIRICHDILTGVIDGDSANLFLIGFAACDV